MKVCLFFCFFCFSFVVIIKRPHKRSSLENKLILGRENITDLQGLIAEQLKCQRWMPVAKIWLSSVLVTMTSQGWGRHVDMVDEWRSVRTDHRCVWYRCGRCLRETCGTFDLDEVFFFFSDVGISDTDLIMRLKVNTFKSLNALTPWPSVAFYSSTVIKVTSSVSFGCRPVSRVELSFPPKSGMSCLSRKSRIPLWMVLKKKNT